MKGCVISVSHCASGNSVVPSGCTYSTRTELLCSAMAFVFGDAYGLWSFSVVKSFIHTHPSSYRLGIIFTSKEHTHPAEGTAWRQHHSRVTPGYTNIILHFVLKGFVLFKSPESHLCGLTVSIWCNLVMGDKVNGFVLNIGTVIPLC